MSLKIKSLEDHVALSDKIKLEMRDKLRITEDGNREMMAFIRNLQQQGDQELASMRNFLQQKITDDQTN